MLNAKPNLNQQKYEEPTAQVYNPTLEKVRIQIDSRGFSFLPLELTEIPLSLAEPIGAKISYKGLFVVWPNQKLSDLDDVKFQALKNFKDFNNERLQMEQTYIDERKKAGVTIDMNGQSNYNKWLKWSKELSLILEGSKIIEPVKSFLDVVKKDEPVVSQEGSDPIVDVETEIEVGSGVVRRRGRPPIAKEI